MSVIENYNKALQELYKHVGFKEDYVVCPIDDCTDMYWSFDEESVRYASTEEDLMNEESHNHYLDDIYTQRFYSKWIYRGEKFTMIFCDPHVDGVKWFRVFDNEKYVESE